MKKASSKLISCSPIGDEFAFMKILKTLSMICYIHFYSDHNVQCLIMHSQFNALRLT